MIEQHLQYTPLDTITSIANDVRHSFHTHKTRTLEYRKVQLRKFYWSYAALSSQGQPLIIVGQLVDSSI